MTEALIQEEVKAFAIGVCSSPHHKARPGDLPPAEERHRRLRVRADRNLAERIQRRSSVRLRLTIEEGSNGTRSSRDWITAANSVITVVAVRRVGPVATVRPMRNRARRQAGPRQACDGDPDWPVCRTRGTDGDRGPKLHRGALERRTDRDGAAPGADHEAAGRPGRDQGRGAGGSRRAGAAKSLSA